MLSNLISVLGRTYILPVVAIAADAAAVTADATDALTATWSPLINIGAIGCVLAWFLIRAEPRLGRIERAIDRSTRANLIMAQIMSDIAEHRRVSETTKVQAKELIKEVDDATTERDN